MVFVGLDLVGVCFPAPISFSSLSDYYGVLESQCSIYYFLPEFSLVVLLFLFEGLLLGRVLINWLKLLNFSEGGLESYDVI